MVNKQFRIGLFNAGSLGTKHEDFMAAATRQQFDVLAVNETWLQAGEQGRAPVLPGYGLRHNPRPLGTRSRGGGVGFYIKRIFNARTWPHPVDPLHKAVEQMWLTLTLNGKKLAIGTAYRPPWMDVDLFFDALCDSVSSLSDYDNLIVLGDFNINFFHNADSKTAKLNTFLTSFHLSQLVTQATHFTDTSQTLIDIVCTDLRAKNVTVEHVGSLYGHCLVVCDLNVKLEKPKPYRLTYRPIKHISLDNLNMDLQSVRWDLLSKVEDVNDLVRTFNQLITNNFDMHAPVKSTIVRTQSYPWVTDTVKLMMRLRDNAAAEYHKNQSEGKKKYYKDLKSTVNKALYFEKSAYFNQNINNKINDPKSL